MKKLSEYEQKVLKHLTTNPGLTTFFAVTELRIMNVQDIIMRLRNYGFDIKKEWRTTVKKKRFAFYFLVKNKA